MERLRITIVALLIAVASYGQTAKQVLDKAAAAVSNKSGITASFTLKGGQMNDKGSISIKGKKFQIKTSNVIIWFDGKTQWSYVRKNDEVNVSTPNESQLQALNPYNFIYMYKKGYNSTMAKKGGNYEVHLTSTDKKKSVQEMYILIHPQTYIPSEIRIKHSKGWNTIEVSNVKKANLSDEIFHFNSKDFPTAEVIDLR
jgi:outer membrane lipoprotein-sorting protein